MNEMQTYATIKLLEMTILSQLKGEVLSHNHLVMEGTTNICYNINHEDTFYTLYIYVQEDGLYKIVVFENADWDEPKLALVDLGIMKVLEFFSTYGK